MKHTQWKRLAGRLLLPEEISVALSLARGEIETFIQLSVETGEIQTVPGMQHSMWRGWTCTRCGSWGSRVVVEVRNCLSCGRRRCAYCAACLRMGHVRACGVLIAVSASTRGTAGKATSSKRETKGKATSPTWRVSGSTTLLSKCVKSVTRTGFGEWLRVFQEIRKSLTNAVYNFSFSCTHSEHNTASDRSVNIGGMMGSRSERGEEFGLTVAQGEAVEKVRSVLGEGRKKEMLLWAVTGAGKTEMLFPLLADAVARGWRVAVATPRRDVVLELVPRMRAAFPRERIVGLHGESRETWDEADIVVATTHQLLRFRAAFDLLVVDELDAFPYAGDRMLMRAARLAVASGGRRLYLTATPSRLLLLHARVGDIGLARVPVRYHGHPLPVPTLARYRAAVFVRAVLASLLRGAQVFVFVPRIDEVAAVVALLEAELPIAGAEGASQRRFRIAGTSSKDASRAAHVLAFRERDLDVIVTTTILERGVTVRKADVHVCEADARVFTATSLIQMAGRAGRSADDAFANVTFWAEENSFAMYRARSIIASTNRLAQRRGYLKGGA